MRANAARIALLAWLAPAPALCEPTWVDQVERLDIERAEGELEWEGVYAEAAAGEPSLLQHVLSGEYGLTDRFSVGFELGALAEDGENLSAEYLVLQAKYMALDPERSPLGLGLQASLGPALNGGSGEAELELLGETRWRALTLAVDVSIESALDRLDEPSTRYALRTGWRRSRGALGLGAGGDIASGEGEEHSHWIGPVLTFESEHGFQLELSDLFGLNDATPDQQIRIQVDVAL